MYPRTCSRFIHIQSFVKKIPFDHHKWRLSLYEWVEKSSERNNVKVKHAFTMNRLYVFVWMISRLFSSPLSYKLAHFVHAKNCYFFKSRFSLCFSTVSIHLSQKPHFTNKHNFFLLLLFFKKKFTTNPNSINLL